MKITTQMPCVKRTNLKSFPHLLKPIVQKINEVK